MTIGLFLWGFFTFSPPSTNFSHLSEECGKNARLLGRENQRRPGVCEELIRGCLISYRVVHVTRTSTIKIDYCSHPEKQK